MKFPYNKVTEVYKIEICLINLIILSYLFRTSIPLLKFPFLLMYISIMGYLSLNYRKQLIPKLEEFIRNYFIFLILATILGVSFLLSHKIYLTVFKDVVNMMILLTIFFILTIIITDIKKLKYFSYNLVTLTVIFALFISILRILDFFNLYSFIDYSKIKLSSVNDSIAVDYNFAVVPAFLGIISVFTIFVKPTIMFKRIFYNILLFIFSFDIILSGSRRGIFALLILIVVLLISQIYAIFKSKSLIGNLGINSKSFLLSLFVFTILLTYITFGTGYSFRIKMLEIIGSKNLTETKVKIANKIYKYSLFNTKHQSFQDFYSTVWPTIPEDPDSGWGTRIHKTVFPLTGKNVEMVPKGVKGYLMDSSCNASYYPNIDLSESYTLLTNLKVDIGDQYKASVFCFVSDSFNVSTVSLGVGSLCISKNIVTGRVSTFYNLDRKGFWQKLEIEFDCTDGEVPILMSFTKSGVKDFSKLKGYIIFANPHSEKINKGEKELDLSVSVVNKELSYQLNDKTNRSNLIQMIDREGKLNIRTSNIHNELNTQKYVYADFFCFSFKIFPFLILQQDDQDPIRKLAAKLISEDTTYYPYKSNIFLDTISNPFIADRLLRWKFALKLFSNEYNWKQKIFGGGFNFLNWYGYYFLGDKTRSDYPHNPFLYILLYSGIIGLSVYLFSLFKVFYYYLKYVKVYPIFFIFFIITFFFSFFSSGSPFDPPIMGFFSILPFFIHSVYERERKELLK